MFTFPCLPIVQIVYIHIQTFKLNSTCPLILSEVKLLQHFQYSHKHKFTQLLSYFNDKRHGKRRPSHRRNNIMKPQTINSTNVEVGKFKCCKLYNLFLFSSDWDI